MHQSIIVRVGVHQYQLEDRRESLSAPAGVDWGESGIGAHDWSDNNKLRQAPLAILMC